MKKILTFMIVVALAVSMVGCDAIQRKFTRKKKKKARRPRIYQVRKYEKIPTPELYNKHFVYWQTWSAELIEVLGENVKKDRRCIQEMVGQLKDMQNILNPEKAAELQPHIDTAEDIRQTIVRGDLSHATESRVRRTLEREDRAIKRNFITSKVKNDIRESFDDDTMPLAAGTETGGDGR